MLRRVVELGVNLIDTADSYGPEVSENLIAEALAPLPRGARRSPPRAGCGAPARASGRATRAPSACKECCEGSLRRLKVDRIDLYQLHSPDPEVPFEESVGALKELQDEGKIRHIGISNVSVEELERHAGSWTWSRCRTASTSRTATRRTCSTPASEAGIGFIPWFPLAVGELARPGGAARRGGRATTTPRRARWRSPGCSRRSPVMLPIPGTASIEHLEENVGAGELRSSTS